jgi:protein-L-isoaspartate(D-aspartate) O-methyltransferase
MSSNQSSLTEREQARFNMIEQQIRTWEVLDPVVLNLLHQVPREEFVPVPYRGLAFADLEIPLGSGEYMLSPKLEARMLQALEIKKTDSVLEIGTGSGYMTALLAKLAKEVYSVERNADLSALAAQRLVAHGISNIILEVGDGAHGWGNDQFDVIVLTGSLPVLPTRFEQQLKPGGRLLAVVGAAPVMEAVLVTCIGPGVYSRTVLFETSIPPLVNAVQPKHFSF